MTPEAELQFKKAIAEIEREYHAARWDSALALTHALLAHYPEQPAAIYMQGLVLRATGERHQAVACFNKALGLNPESKEACQALAITLGELGEPLLAVDVYEHWIKIEQFTHPLSLPTISPARAAQAAHWVKQGEAFEQRGDRAAAADAYRQALTTAPYQREALMPLAHALYHGGNAAEAREYALIALRVQPYDAAALALLGHCYASDEPLLAVACWRMAVSADADQAAVWLTLAIALAELGAHTEALAAYTQLLRLEPENAQARDAIAAHTPESGISAH